MPWSDIQKLNETHDTSVFESGLESVDDWFKHKAYANRQNVGTHVCMCPKGEIVAFYALKTIIVPTEGMSSALRSGSFEGQSVGILLCQMGVCKLHQGNGAGKKLLKSAMQYAADSHHKSPVQLFVVDAENEKLVPFYEKAGLKLIPGSFRLVAPMKAVLKALN